MSSQDDVCRDIAQPGLARLTGGQKVESSNLSIPTIFFAQIPGKKMVNEDGLDKQVFASLSSGVLTNEERGDIRASYIRLFRLGTA